MNDNYLPIRIYFIEIIEGGYSIIVETIWRAFALVKNIANTCLLILNQLPFDLEPNFKIAPYIIIRIPLTFLYEFSFSKPPNSWRRRCNSCGNTLECLCLGENKLAKTLKIAKKQKHQLQYYVSQLIGVILKFSLRVIIPMPITFTAALISLKPDNNWRGDCDSHENTIFHAALVW